MVFRVARNSWEQLVCLTSFLKDNNRIKDGTSPHYSFLYRIPANTFSAICPAMIGWPGEAVS